MRGFLIQQGACVSELDWQGKATDRTDAGTGKPGQKKMNSRGRQKNEIKSEQRWKKK